MCRRSTPQCMLNKDTRSRGLVCCQHQMDFWKLSSNQQKALKVGHLFDMACVAGPCRPNTLPSRT